MLDTHIDPHVSLKPTTEHESPVHPSQNSLPDISASIHALPRSRPASTADDDGERDGEHHVIPAVTERSSPVGESKLPGNQISGSVAEQGWYAGWFANKVAVEVNQGRTSKAPDERRISYNTMARCRVPGDREQQGRLVYDERDGRRLDSVLPQEEVPEGSQWEETQRRQARTRREEDVEKPIRTSSVEERHSGQGLRDFDYDPIECSDIENGDYRKLDFKPLLVRTWFLAVTVVFYLSCIAAIVAMLEWSRRNGGIDLIHTTYGALACRYVPSAIGFITTLWWRTVVTTFSRISPYISMAAERSPREISGSRNRKAQRTLHAFYADAMFLPDFHHLPSLARNGHWLLFATTLASIIVGVSLVGLKAAFVQVTPKGAEWNIAVSAKIGYSLISIYGLLSVMTASILLRIRHRDTGLRWDPVSVADQLALLQNSNIGSLYAGLETCLYKEYREVLRKRALDFGPIRLGYWKNRQNGAVWHGIALLQKHAATATAEQTQSHTGAALRTRSIRASHGENSTELPWESNPPLDNEAKAKSGQASVYPCNEMPVDRHGRLVSRIEYFAHRSGLLTDTSIAMAIAIALTVSALVVSGLINGNLPRGIHIIAASGNKPSLSFWIPSDTSKPYSTKEAFLFRFLPVSLMACFSILWVNIDHFYRYTQPFAGMANAAPATANILLDYPSLMPIQTTFKAVANKHWRVVLFSLLSLTASVPPIVASGIFVGIPDATGFNEHIQPINFWFSFSILLMYLLCLVVARPPQAYRLPRNGIYTIGDLMQWCYASRIFDEELHGRPVFEVQDADDERIQLLSRIHLAKRNYQFGLYLGIDGRRHLGFDVAERNNASGQLEYVDKVDPGPTLYFRCDGIPCYLRRPRIVRRFE